MYLSTLTTHISQYLQSGDLWHEASGWVSIKNASAISCKAATFQCYTYSLLNYGKGVKICQNLQKENFVRLSPLVL